LLEDFTFKNVQERLIKILLNDYEKNNNQYTACTVSQSDLASRLGTCREVVSRSLSKLKQDGLITTETKGRFSHILIKDLEKMKLLSMSN